MNIKQNKTKTTFFKVKTTEADKQSEAENQVIRWLLLQRQTSDVTFHGTDASCSHEAQVPSADLHLVAFPILIPPDSLP